MNHKYQKTIYACFMGYVVQAIVNNFIPLLFLTFQSSYDITLSKITFLVTVNFGLQLLVDLLSIRFIDRIGYRTSALLAHIFAASGLLLLTILPECTPDPYIGIFLSVMVYAVGGGLLEVLISPIVEACPTDNKEKAMSLLHSFYCWGHVGVVLLSTIFFTLFGIEHWKFLAIFWALIPLLNALAFTRVPIAPLLEEGQKGLSLHELVRKKVFWVLVLLMVCAGASEQAVSQWASTFAEKGLHVSKSIGDLTGPMLFAILMGTSRAIYGKYGDKINLKRFMLYSCIACILSYLLISLSTNPFLGLIGCGLTGFSVGILWPGSFSIASATLRGGGTAMFAILALAGDLGCSSGPTYVGLVSSAFSDNLKAGILAAILFPLLLIVGILLLRPRWKSK
ncbi:MFS transporter [Anaerosporobacter faecicola]|uniref:MFS transporter n=1 Tax=Anaerosporobacter faecicola TaxID=2718714 RepID=UPI00143AEAFE|nr:MFS transporter [Anaerosporobacter faecicola]